MYFVVIAEHPPNLCPHSNSIVRKKFEEREAGGQGDDHTEIPTVFQMDLLMFALQSIT
jgi:hypothetical protein